VKRISALILLFVFFAAGGTFSAQAQYHEKQPDNSAELISTSIVISQVYGGGGNSGAQFTHDFVELFNRGSQPVSLNGWSTQYASSTGTEFLVTPLSNVTLQPGQYYLIQYASNGAIGSALPTPDRIAPAVTNQAGNTFIPNLSSTNGKVALVNSITQLPASTCPVDASIIDFYGYGTANCSEGTAGATLSNTTAAFRAGGGCTDTDSNSADFSNAAPAPRNTATATNACNTGGSLQASGNATPNTVPPGSATLMRVTVIPATTPPSTGIAVVANLTQLGGSATQTFFDDGTNGDTTAGDNIFSFNYTVPAATTGGVKIVNVTVTDAQARSVNPMFNVTVQAAPPNDDPLLLGNPTNATTNTANENNYLMVKPQYTLSYNRSRAIANWVGWRIDSSWLGTAPRQDDFRADTDLPAGWYRVQDGDYSGSGFDRGHMVASADRTRSIPDNSATFLMTNIIPQLPANNQGPWADFEDYLRTLVNAGNELYIFSGGHGSAGTIAGGQIAVPAVTWKVVLVIPNGDNDLSRIDKSVRAIAIVIPNQAPVGTSDPWRQYRKTIKYVEGLTGYDFFSLLPANTQQLLKQKRDRQ
jgi:DNA/RNA endonuclease G (NUC1)